LERQVNMKVYIKGIGDLMDYLGKGAREVELPDHAHVKDLLLRIEEIWGTGFPPYLWDFKQHQFRGPVFLVIDKKAVQDDQTPLQDGIEIRVIRGAAGG
jgi:hypothetical protein